MQTPNAKEERPIPAYQRRRETVSSELREILGMRHLWVADADGKRLEPDPATDYRDRAAQARKKAAMEMDQQIRQGFIQIAETLERLALTEERTNSQRQDRPSRS
jgi:hypothetical protein